MLDRAKQRIEEDQEKNISKNDLEDFKLELQNRLEILDLAMDVAKQKAEEDQEKNLKKK